jgi:5'-nucleotidase
MVKKKPKPRILLTNDDGINAPGITALYKAMKSIGDCTVLAPDSEKSAQGHAITMKIPLRLNEYYKNDTLFGWTLNGTCADCVKFGIHELMEVRPDLVVSGINQGPNTAVNTIYSGTVAGAAEGGLMNIPAIAISLASYTYRNFDIAADIANYFAKLVLKNGLPDYTFLNINVPPKSKEELKGIKITKMGLMRYEEKFDKRVDPANRTYYWLAGEKVILDNSEDNDEIAVHNDFVTVSPLICDMTNYDAVGILKNWDINYK